jgi:hypothetical protein
MIRLTCPSHEAEKEPGPRPISRTNSPDHVTAVQEVTILGGIDQVEPFVTNVIRYRPDGSKHRVWP